MTDIPKKLSDKGSEEMLYKGYLVGEFPSLVKEGEVKCQSSCECKEDGEVYFISKAALNEFFTKNPGIFVQFKDQYIIK